jgi:hypothetical protein
MHVYLTCQLPTERTLLDRTGMVATVIDNMPEEIRWENFLLIFLKFSASTMQVL